ncbi:MAG: DUF2254 family protein [Deltaproteobacteria bacterium]|nr:DUF2254 family protein [Deltaproteobacteria bacterium]
MTADDTRSHGTVAIADDEEERRARTRAVRSWLLPFAVLSLGVVLLVGIGHSADNARSLTKVLSSSDPSIESDVLANVAQLVGQVLGVAISVVAIIVELAANRYTHRITEQFFRARTNITVMGLYVVSAVQPMWASFSAGAGPVPRPAAIMAMILMSASVLSLLPYFAYVAAFVSPLEVIRRLRRDALQSVELGPRRTGARDVQRHQRAAEEAADQLTDVALNAMAHHDKAIAMAAINAIGDLLEDYVEIKDQLPPHWFKLSHAVRANPDFVSLAPVALEQIEDSRTWFEFKLMRQYEMVYRQSLNTHRELNYLIASNVRKLAAVALVRKQPAVSALAIKFFNTFLRATLNGRDVRTGYNVLNQYRQIAESALRRGDGALAVSIAKHFKYYGQTAFAMDLGFLLETAAYDLCAINELAFDLQSTERRELLRVFLQVDKEGEGARRETALRGVRKAQIKLAAYYLQHGDSAAAKQVYRDMANENVQRLASIRDELLAVDSPYYWEVTDRGMNFDWMPVERRGRIIEFFEWFGDALPQPRASIVPPNVSDLLQGLLGGSNTTQSDLDDELEDATPSPPSIDSHRSVQIDVPDHSTELTPRPLDDD